MEIKIVLGTNEEKLAYPRKHVSSIYISQVKLTSSFSKCCIEEKRAIQPQVKYLLF